MKTNIKYILKVSIIIAVGVFLIERLFSKNGFEVTAVELLKNFGIHFMYGFVITCLNAYFFSYIDTHYKWNKESKQRIVIGAIGSVLVTMFGIVLLRFVTLVVILGNPISTFFNDKNATNYYLFSFIITLVISLIFHVIYFYKAITENKVKEQQIVAKTETAKFESLKSQIDPHFLFNSLNVLTSLIGENPKQAEKFTTKLSKVYRYVLEQKSKDLIELNEELQFAIAYTDLLKMRFENAVTFEIPEKASLDELKIIPLSLQLLLENSIKHNVVSEENPLVVKIEENDGYLVVTNNYNPKSTLEKGTKVGLQNIIDRYNLLTLKKVEVQKTATTFIVKLPLLTQKTSIVRTIETEQSSKYIRAVERVEEIKGFYSSIIAYCIVIPFLIYINLKFVPQFHWFWFPLMGWGIGLIFQGFKAFAYNPFLGKNWEERKIRELMDNDREQFWE
jgi:hypothetical protein